MIIEWFESAAEDVRDVDAFRDGLCRGDENAVKQALDRILGDEGIGATDPDVPLPYHLLLQGLCFGLPGYANPASRRKRGANRWDIQVFPTGSVLDVADTIGMLEERPLITINLMYDPGVDALGLELLAVQALLDIERDGIDKIRVPRPGVGVCAGDSVLTGSMWQRCASGCRGRMSSFLAVNTAVLGLNSSDLRSQRGLSAEQFAF